MNEGRTQTADEILDEMKRYWTDTFRFYGNKGNEERERWVAHTFINALGISANESEFTSAPQAFKFDVLYGDARFQVKEIIEPDSKRSDEIRGIYERVMLATILAETVGPGFAYDVPAPTNGTALIIARAAELAAQGKYMSTKPGLDLLIYVTRTRVSHPQAIEVDQEQAASLGWRSISALGGSWASVLYAADTAPAILRRSVRDCQQ